MIDKESKIYICRFGHIQKHNGKCEKCGCPKMTEHPQVVTKEK